MVEKVELSENCKKLLRKLYNRRCFGGKHTDEKNVLRAIKHLPREEQKRAFEDWKWCKNQGLVIVRLKTNEVHVSLNPRRLKEIDELIELESGDNND